MGSDCAFRTRAVTEWPKLFVSWVCQYLDLLHTSFQCFVNHKFSSPSTSSNDEYMHSVENRYNRKNGGIDEIFCNVLCGAFPLSTSVSPVVCYT